MAVLSGISLPSDSQRLRVEELYRVQGRYNEAEPLHQQALELRQRLLGDNHPDVASSLHNLCLLYFSQERYNEAEPLLQEALEIFIRTVGENHPYTITCRSQLVYLQLQLYISNFKE